MKKWKKKVFLITLGIGLVVFALVPTPDDVTVISPLVIFSAGLTMIKEAL